MISKNSASIRGAVFYLFIRQRLLFAFFTVLFYNSLAPNGHNTAREMLPFGNIFWVICMEIKRLRDLREDHDKTQQHIADILNMHRSVYRRYESGERETPAWVVVKLADYYKVSTDYLLGRTDEPTPPKEK